MTIQEAIEKAIEGGYPKQRVEDLALACASGIFPGDHLLGGIGPGTRDRG